MKETLPLVYVPLAAHPQEPGSAVLSPQLGSCLLISSGGASAAVLPEVPPVPQEVPLEGLYTALPVDRCPDDLLKEASMAWELAGALRRSTEGLGLQAGQVVYDMRGRRRIVKGTDGDLVAHVSASFPNDNPRKTLRKHLWIDPVPSRERSRRKNEARAKEKARQKEEAKNILLEAHRDSLGNPVYRDVLYQGDDGTVWRLQRQCHWNPSLVWAVGKNGPLANVRKPLRTEWLTPLCSD